ncbi:metalloregulator ArsR/SmtB family transcription factor [Lentilitoribacter sp. Alg239-R112]|jgi:DNA-binding transcriptional ArsR family regulator|uniref:ArsR/SmtB family transcription factor n=1 Tax=Lentilitoribacter sp. Alg239-R112 TaxID=2305987 RepID=UPI0013A6E718|nr:metalloregulator ArsR/SmtB family transcription factor [Lentilitoribacter sp. Alg239-R112]
MNTKNTSCKFENDAKRLSALAHPVRLKIVRHLVHENACCVKNLVERVDLAQSTVSQHLKTLLNAGLVTYQTRQQSSWYEINREEFAKLSDSLNVMFDECCNCEIMPSSDKNVTKK